MTGCSSLLGFGLVEDTIVLDDVSGPFGPSLFVLGHFFLLGVGLGLSMRWAGVVKFFDPIRTCNLTVRFLKFTLNIKICMKFERFFSKLVQRKTLFFKINDIVILVWEEYAST